jgi:hypothetical protein
MTRCQLRSGFLLLLCNLAGIPAPAATFEQALGGHQDLKIAEEASAAHALHFRQGHLNLDLLSGSAAVVLAGGRPVGIYFRGEGRLSYASADQIEWPVMFFNLRKATGLSGKKAGAFLTVGDSFKDALILAAGRDLPKPDGAAAASPAESFARHREKFQRDASVPAGNDASIAVAETRRSF